MKTIRAKMEEYIARGVPKDEALDKAYGLFMVLEYQKRIRLDKRIESYIRSGRGYFFTLTYTNEFIERYSEERLLKFAKNWCTKYLESYIGNIDYGKENGRFHVHVVGIPKREFALTWWCGSMDFVKIYNDKHKAIRNYILKLVNHAVKGTTSKIFRSKTFNQWEGIE